MDRPATARRDVVMTPSRESVVSRIRPRDVDQIDTAREEIAPDFFVQTELKAMRAIAEALGAVDEGARSRILGWAQNIFAGGDVGSADASAMPPSGAISRSTESQPASPDDLSLDGVENLFDDTRTSGCQLSKRPTCRSRRPPPLLVIRFRWRA